MLGGVGFGRRPLFVSAADRHNKLAIHADRAQDKASPGNNNNTGPGG